MNFPPKQSPVDKQKETRSDIGVLVSCTVQWMYLGMQRQPTCTCTCVCVSLTCNCENASIGVVECLMCEVSF